MLLFLLNIINIALMHCKDLFTIKMLMFGLKIYLCCLKSRKRVYTKFCIGWSKETRGSTKKNINKNKHYVVCTQRSFFFIAI